MAEPGYIVLARKYRPRRFSDLIGQPHVSEALANAVVTGRLAQAFLLTGSRGTGKTTTARILAAALNCALRPKDSAEPCGECPSCLDIARGEDLDVIEMDAASNSRVDDIRERLDSVDTRPARGRFRVYIIDEVHMLSSSAFNALLKTVEEPPPHVKFILATTNPEKIPETILSRCQRYDFRRVTLAEIEGWLSEICKREGAAPGDGVLRSIAEMAEGGIRDALGRLDQLIAFAGTAPTLEQAEKVFGLVGRGKLLELLEALAKGDAAAGVHFAEEVFDSGKDVAEVLGSLVALTRALLLAASGAEARALDVPADELPRLQQVAKAYGLTGLVYLAELLNDCRQRVRRAAFPRVLVETTLVKLALVGRLESIETLLSRLDEAADSSAPAVPAAPAPSPPSAPPAPAEAPAPAAAAAPPLKRAPTEQEKAAVEALRRKFGARP
jgi:DNA polymerase III subunit gamma/tau